MAVPVSSIINWSTGGMNSLINLGADAYSIYYNNNIGKAQERIVKAQGQQQANSYAAQAIGYEQNAQRLSEAYGQEEYETIRQQNSYMEDMKLDAAARGVATEGTEAYMQATQAREFARTNAYASLQDTRQQANYMLAATQSLMDADSSLASADLMVNSMKAYRHASVATGFINAVTTQQNIFNQTLGREVSSVGNSSVLNNFFGL